MDFFTQFTEGVDGTPENTFYKKNKDEPGRYRVIGRPNEPMLEVQKRIEALMRRIAPSCPNASAAKGGLGSVRNARLHAKRPYLFKLDLAHAFDSVDASRLCQLIEKRARVCLRREGPLPSADEWYRFLKPYCFTRRDGLIQGAATSPLFLDWYCEEHIDRHIRYLIWYRDRWSDTVITHRLLYTRYVDDLVFSSPLPITKRVRRMLRRVIARSLFLENHKKTEVAQLWTRGRTVEVTGNRIGRRETGNFGLGRKKVKELERALTDAVELPLFTESPEVLEGKVGYLLETLRGKRAVNRLEERVLDLFIRWCTMTGKDGSWAQKVLAHKTPVLKAKKRAKKKLSPAELAKALDKVY